MYYNRSLNIYLFLGTIVTIGVIVLVNNNSIYAKQAIWRDFDTMKELVNAIRDGEKDDNNINWEKFQTSDIYQDEDKNTRDCIKLAHKIGNNLGDYEIVHCFKDVNYFKNKYSPDASSEDNASLNVPESNASLNVPESNASQDVNIEKINLEITVDKDPISHGESQIVAVVVSDSATGKTLDHVFLRLTIKDPIGIIIKNYTGTEGSLTRSFKISENAVGTFTILATASQAGVESTKTLTFQVQ